MKSKISSKRGIAPNRVEKSNAELKKPSFFRCMEGQLDDLANLPPEYSVFNFDDAPPTFDTKGRVIGF